MGGGGHWQNFFPVAAGKYINKILSIAGDFFTFPGDLEMTRHFWRLTQIAGDLAGLLTHSKNVTTSIHWRKKHLPKVWGAMAPFARPPGYGVRAYGRYTQSYVNSKALFFVLFLIWIVLAVYYNVFSVV